jgi:hypothetical protein
MICRGGRLNGKWRGKAWYRPLSSGSRLKLLPATDKISRQRDYSQPSRVAVNTDYYDRVEEIPKGRRGRAEASEQEIAAKTTDQVEY